MSVPKKRTTNMMRFIYDFVKKNAPVSESTIVKVVLDEYDWREYSRWQMRGAVIEKLKFLSDVGILYYTIRRRRNRGRHDFIIMKYYTMGKYDIGVFPKFRLHCKLGALFYGGGMGEGFLYPLFRFEQISFDGCKDDDDSEYVIDVYYDGRDARKCYRHLVKKFREELRKLRKKVMS